MAPPAVGSASSSAGASSSEPQGPRLPLLRVAVRVRPCHVGEVGHVECEPRVGSVLSVALPAPAQREFGMVLGPSCSQSDVYVTCGSPMLDAALNGKDSLVFDAQTAAQDALDVRRDGWQADRRSRRIVRRSERALQAPWPSRRPATTKPWATPVEAVEIGCRPLRTSAR